MNFSLRVLPLQILENFATQKCLLPKEKFPQNLKPGTWAKCMLDNGGFSICQIYPRNIAIDYCYMDETVTGTTTTKSSNTERSLVALDKLTIIDTPPDQIEITITVTERFFREHNKKLKLTRLKDAIQQLAQSLYLTCDCTLRLPELTETGVAHVKVDTVSDYDSSTLCQITDDTVIKVNDVCLLSNILLEDNENYCSMAWERARQDLDELLQMAQMQKYRGVGKFRSSLNVLLLGATGSGKSTMIKAFVKEHNCNCFRITPAQVLGQYPGETETKLRHIFEAARTFERNLQPKLPTIIILEDLNLFCPAEMPNNRNTDNGHALRVCAQLLLLVDELHRAEERIICLATCNKPETLNEMARRPGRFDREFNIPVPTADVRKHLFTALYQQTYMTRNGGPALTSILIDLVVQHTQGYVAADLALLVRNIEQRLINADGKGELATAVRECLSKSQPSSMHATDVSILKPAYGFDSIGGMQMVKNILEISVLAAIKQHKIFQRFGLHLPRGVLLYGPPGCAKTKIAQCLAHEANFNFISTSGAEVYSPYVGCAEKFITKLFNTARVHAPCVIFLDEIDTLVGRRMLATSSADVQMRILSTLLTEMDGLVTTVNSKHILVVAATNRPDMIDDALMRPGRFDKLIHVSAPDFSSRISLLQLYARRMPFASNVNLELIADRTSNYSGADICNLCNEAALRAFQRDFNTTEITGNDFERVLATLKSSLSQPQIDWYAKYDPKFCHNCMRN